MITIENRFILQLNKYLEFFFNSIQSIRTKSDLTKKHLDETSIDLNQYYQYRNKSFYKKYFLLIYDLCLIKSTKIHLELIEKQYDYSKQFYKKIFNIQSFNSIEQYQEQYNQSIKCLDELKLISNQYELKLKELKEKLSEQNKDISNLTLNLFHIQYEQNQLELNIQELKKKILFENNLYYEIKQLMNIYFKFDQNYFQVQSSIVNDNLENEFYIEYIHISTDIMQMKFYIEQTSKNLLILENDFNHMNVTSTKNLFVSKMNTKLQVSDQLMKKSRQSKFKLVIRNVCPINRKRATFLIV